MTNYKIEIIQLEDRESILRQRTITAVFLIAIVGNGILCCRNERGWDIPGGHVEIGESFVESLQREVREETGASFDNPIPFALLTPEGSQKSMLFYVTNNFSLGDFIPSDDALEMSVLSRGVLIDRYHGNKSLLEKLLSYAEKAMIK